MNCSLKKYIMYESIKRGLYGMIHQVEPGPSAYQRSINLLFVLLVWGYKYKQGGQEPGMPSCITASEFRDQKLCRILLKDRTYLTTDIGQRKCS